MLMVVEEQPKGKIADAAPDRPVRFTQPSCSILARLVLDSPSGELAVRFA